MRQQGFVTASRISGTRRGRIIRRHLAPNVFPAMLTFALLNVGFVIIAEGALDFLGMGIPAPTPSWGGMIALGQQRLSSQPSLLLVPSFALLVTVLALNKLGDGVRRRLGVS